jgi:DNA-binding XRE family transcriptional regulator
MKSKLAHTFGRFVALRRADVGMNPAGLARRAGLSDQAVYDVESGRRQPTLETARRLLAALGLTLADAEPHLPPVELPEAGPDPARGRPKKIPEKSSSKT